MTRIAPLALAALTVVSAAPAQTGPHTYTDPANLRGERVNPRTGRELPIDGGEPFNQMLALEQSLRRLNTRASLMLIVAHPDDEDGGMLTFYSRGRGARVAVLTLTRGEGGQNAVTGDFEDALGLLRTQELLSADRYSGVQQMFGTEVDFGFSKTKAEAFRKWGHDRVLYDAVRAVRLFRPLVIAAVFSGSVTDGHGQHQVSGEIAQEVFKAAGDPNVFPDLTREGILPWQPLKMYARVPMQAISDKGLFDYATGQYVPAEFTNYITGQTTTTPPAPDVLVHEGETDPLLSFAAARPEDLQARPADPGASLSYVQFARIGLGLQRSQIGSGVRVPPAGKFDVAYHRYGSKLPDQPLHETSFFDAIDVTLNGMVRLAPTMPNNLREQIVQLGLEIANASSSFEQDHDPAALAPRLANAMKLTAGLVSSVGQANLPADQSHDLLHELRVKHAQLNEALVLALGTTLTAHGAASSPACQGAVYPECAGQVNTAFANGPTAPIQVVSDFTSTADHAPRERTWAPSDPRTQLAPGARLDAAASGYGIGWPPEGHPGSDAATLNKALPILEGRPYFHRDGIERPVYDLSEPQFRLAPQAPPEAFWTRFRFNGVEAVTGRVVTTDAHSTTPLFFAPSLTLALPAHAMVFPRHSSDIPITVEIRSAFPRRAPVQGDLPVTVPAGWSTRGAAAPAFKLKPGSTEAHVQFALVPDGVQKPGEVGFRAEVPNGRPPEEQLRWIGYGDLPRTPMYEPASLRAVAIDLQLPPAGRRRIGYLAGTGDAVPEALGSIGLPVVPLTVADLTPARLAAFDTVVLGVRTYAAHPDLHGAPTRALFDFARAGGNVVVQYQSAEFRPDDAPLPVELGSSEKVVDETAPVHLLDPASPLLTAPNRITEADFDHWIEERGHGFLSTWDPHYTALTETHDPGEPAEHIQPQAPQRGGLITTPLGKGRWTYIAFALYRQLPEAVPGAFRLFVNLVNPPAK